MILLKKLRVEGKSMLPTFKPEDEVLVSVLPYFFRAPSINDIVLMKYKERFLIKRIVKVRGDDYFAQGDNKRMSTDSRQFGWVTRAAILGKVIYSSFGPERESRR